MFTLNIPLPDFTDKTVKEIKKLLDSYKEAANAGPVRGGVISEGDAAAYALVWEWGNARQTKEGPKTVRGINPDGDPVWLSIQAPYGYIRIHDAEAVNIIEMVLATADFESPQTGKQLIAEMKRAAKEAGGMIAELIKNSAPVDSGDLKDSIKAADPDDPDLKSGRRKIELGTTNFSHAARRTVTKLKGTKRGKK